MGSWREGLADGGRLPPLGKGGPRVTVVMPTFRRPHHIGETLRSVLDGEWQDFELLVRDDGDGSDGTAEAVAAAASGDPRVHYHRNANRLAMPGNLNSGIREAAGELIAVCHDHDLYRATFLSEMVAVLDRNPTALFVHCAIDVVTQSGAFVRSHVGPWPELSPGSEWLKFMLRGLNSPVCALTMVRRKAHEEHGLYDPSYGFIADVEMWMRLSRSGDVIYIPRPLVRVREREDNHEVYSIAPTLVGILGKMHRKYLPYAFGRVGHLPRRAPLEGRLLYRLLRDQLSRARPHFL